MWKGKDDIKYKTEEDIKRLDAAANREPNQGILDHERKRKLEVSISVADPKQKFRILFRIRIRPEVSFGSGLGSGFESGSESWIRI